MLAKRSATTALNYYFMQDTTLGEEFSVTATGDYWVTGDKAALPRAARTVKTTLESTKSTREASRRLAASCTAPARPGPRAALSPAGLTQSEHRQGARCPRNVPAPGRFRSVRPRCEPRSLKQGP